MPSCISYLLEVLDVWISLFSFDHWQHIRLIVIVGNRFVVNCLHLVTDLTVPNRYSIVIVAVHCQDVHASKQIEVAHLSVDARDVTILMVQDQSQLTLWYYIDLDIKELDRDIMILKFMNLKGERLPNSCMMLMKVSILKNQFWVPLNQCNHPVLSSRHSGLGGC